MQAFPYIGLSIVMIMFAVVCASANPSMLPKHEGYPMGKATDPVTGHFSVRLPLEAHPDREVRPRGRGLRRIPHPLQPEHALDRQPV